MSINSAAVCKVIVQDSSPEYEQRIKAFCDDNNLIAVKSTASNIMDVLKSNVDLGAIFLSADLRHLDDQGKPLYQKIHKIRPELPIILRTEASEREELNTHKNQFCVSYEIDHISDIITSINEHIFNKDYPNALIRGIKEITNDALLHLFPNTELETSLPYLIKDRIIYGQLFSLIPLESAWCRGYMMLQTDAKHVNELVRQDILQATTEADFRVINDVLSEVTNMIWGKIKNRFISESSQSTHLATQVPIIVNHENKYITFGTVTPQLCFKYTLRQKSGEQKEVTLYQKFIFNLCWEPEKFSENQPTVDDFLESGELEFF